jgi:suppressor for copper-sensitivity B
MRVGSIVVAALVAAFHLAPMRAQTAAPSTKADFSARLVVGGTEANDPATAWLGLDVHLGPGWHTYWRSAGDAGAPPEFDWSASHNVAQTTVEWPAPHRFSEDGIDTFGYADRVLFPVKLRLQDPSKPAHVSLKLTLYVCSTICTQNDVHLEADVPQAADQADALNLIGEWRSKVPPSHSPTISIRSLKLERQGKPRLVLDVHARPALSQPDVFVDGDTAVAGDPPQIEQAADGVSLITVPLDGLDHAHPNQPLHVTLVDGSRALEAVLPQSAGAATVASPTPAPAETNTIWSIIALSLLGGFILNFMPCVFPVLSLKLVSLMQQASGEVRSARVQFTASAAGIVASFLALAAILILLKSGGAEIGWGIQFQQPAFLIAMAAILAAFAANLLGLFEIRLPWWLARRVGNAIGGGSIASHFVNGFVMTLLATPCSAPFVGTAVAFALSRNAPQILIVFAGLGLGMASPYLLLAAVPQVSRVFPRPGPWMVVLRRIAAAAMVATSVWLLTILAGLDGTGAAVLIAASLAAMGLLFAKPLRRLTRTTVGGFAVALVAFGFIAAERLPQSSGASDVQEISWQPFVPENIAQMVRSGRTVFVDVGASWCVTCKVNETLVIDSASVRRHLVSDVVPIKADWTRPNETISAYLQSFHRYGLPFNAVFGPAAPAGIVLPELLTQKAVLDAFDAASQHASLAH